MTQPFLSSRRPGRSEPPPLGRAPDRLKPKGRLGQDPELDAKRFRRTENGVTLITQPMLDKLGR